MLLKWISVSVAFAVTLYMLFLVSLFYYDDKINVKKSKQENEHHALYDSGKYYAKDTDDFEVCENETKSHYTDFTLEEKDASANITEENDSVIRYMEKAEKSIASRRRSLMRKLDLLDQEDRAVRAAFKRTLERMRIDRLERPDSPRTQRVNAYEENTSEIPLPYVQ